MRHHLRRTIHHVQLRVDPKYNKRNPIRRLTPTVPKWHILFHYLQVDCYLLRLEYLRLQRHHHLFRPKSV